MFIILEYENLIELDIWSNFGSFTKGFATSGGVLTYHIPPKTVIIGLVGAVLGIDYNDYKQIDENTKEYTIEKLYDIKVSIQSLFDLNSKRVSFNQVREKTLNIHQDVLIKPYYKLFLSFPNTLKNEEEIFIESIMSNKTVYSLYMGRNEFPLNYDLKNIIPYSSKIINNDNIGEFFKQKVKIYGILDKRVIKNVKLVNEKISDFNVSFIPNSVKNLPSFFEYIVKDFPIKRNNFTEFTYAPISFFSTKNEEDVYYAEFTLKKDCEVEMVKVGDSNWINMI